MREGPHIPTLYDIHFFHVHLLHLPTLLLKIQTRHPSQKAQKIEKDAEYISTPSPNVHLTTVREPTYIHIDEVRQKLTTPTMDFIMQMLGKETPKANPKTLKDLKVIVDANDDRMIPGESNKAIHRDNYNALLCVTKRNIHLQMKICEIVAYWCGDRNGDDVKFMEIVIKQLIKENAITAQHFLQYFELQEDNGDPVQFPPSVQKLLETIKTLVHDASDDVETTEAPTRKRKRELSDEDQMRKQRILAISSPAQRLMELSVFNMDMKEKEDNEHFSKQARSRSGRTQDSGRVIIIDDKDDTLQGGGSFSNDDGTRRPATKRENAPSRSSTYISDADMLDPQSPTSYSIMRYPPQARGGKGPRTTAYEGSVDVGESDDDQPELKMVRSSQVQSLKQGMGALARNPEFINLIASVVRDVNGKDISDLKNAQTRTEAKTLELSAKIDDNKTQMTRMFELLQQVAVNTGTKTSQHSADKPSAGSAPRDATGGGGGGGGGGIAPERDLTEYSVHEFVSDEFFQAFSTNNYAFCWTELQKLKKENQLFHKALEAQMKARQGSIQQIWSLVQLNASSRSENKGHARHPAPAGEKAKGANADGGGSKGPPTVAKAAAAVTTMEKRDQAMPPPASAAGNQEVAREEAGGKNRPGFKGSSPTTTGMAATAAFTDGKRDQATPVTDAVTDKREKAGEKDAFGSFFQPSHGQEKNPWDSNEMEDGGLGE